MNRINVIIPMAGLGKRFSDRGYGLTKSLLPLGDKTMIGAVVKNLDDPRFFFTFVINNQQLSSKDISNSVTPIIPNRFQIVEIDYLPLGPAASCACAFSSIDMKLPLVITNCDQIIEDFNADMFLRFCETHVTDGVLGVFHGCSPKNSYVKLSDNNKVTDVKEKEVISNVATNGFHWWKYGSFFSDSYNLMTTNKDVVNNEFYVAPSYNYMIRDGLNVMPYWFNLHYPIGTPEDYEAYKKLRHL